MISRKFLPQLLCTFPRIQAQPASRRWQSSLATCFNDLVSQPTSKYQIYFSTSNDPVVNLSIEHHILQKSHEDSTVLFLYVNRPCVVIGRNQNPWLETNLRLLSTPGSGDQVLGQQQQQQQQSSVQGNAPLVELVRRRSGGGTVFHDRGNVNYSVTCPPAAFTRDKHAEMIVRAMRRETDRARVNARHDIVLDQGNLLPLSERPSEDNYNASPYDPSSFVKISGSAYKLTRKRALHHGTCLVQSPNIGQLGVYLRSPASPYVKAKGVDSVRSPVGNAYSKDMPDSVQRFQRDAIDAFTKMYGVREALDERLWGPSGTTFLETFGQGVVGRIGEELMDIESIASGVDEMRSPSWIFTQTPQFTFSTYPTEEDPRERPPLPTELPSSTRMFLKARNGSITDVSLSTSPVAKDAEDEVESFREILVGQQIHSLGSWKHVLSQANMASRVEKLHDVAEWLDTMFGTGGPPLSR